MKLITLTKGKFAQVDDEDYDRISKHNWSAILKKRRWYAVRPEFFYVKGHKKSGYCKRVYMHREILLCVRGDKKTIDHKDHNGLNNLKLNLRFCTRHQNDMNSRKPLKESKSKFKGVSSRKNKSGTVGKNMWRAYIKYNYKQIWLGAYPTEKEAARAYNEGAKKYFGEFAELNQIQDEIYTS